MRRLLPLALCVLGAGVVWLVPVQDRPPASRALALLVLAGVGALIAARPGLRRVIAVVLVLTGAGVAFEGSVVTIVAGLLIVAGGAIAVGTAAGWPQLGTRYEPPVRSRLGPDEDERFNKVTAGRRNLYQRPVNAEKTDMWAALDRGEDPTA